MGGCEPSSRVRWQWRYAEVGVKGLRRDKTRSPGTPTHSKRGLIGDRRIRKISAKSRFVQRGNIRPKTAENRGFCRKTRPKMGAKTSQTATVAVASRWLIAVVPRSYRIPLLRVWRQGLSGRYRRGFYSSSCSLPVVPLGTFFGDSEVTVRLTYSALHFVPAVCTAWFDWGAGSCLRWRARL